MTLPTRNPWIDNYQSTIGFGLQAFPLREDPEPGKRVLQAGLVAEEVGLDGFFIGDHPAYQVDPWLHLAWLAASTESIHLGSVVNCAIYRHPAMYARLAADLDRMSGGRLVFGLGIGWDTDEFGALGLDFDSIPERQAAMSESLEIIDGLWGSEQFTYHGQHFSTTNGQIVPGPLQHPRPPVMIAGSGERTTLKQVATYADICNLGPGLNTGRVRSENDLQRKWSVLRQHCEDVGRNYDDILRSHFTSWIMLAETDEAAQAKVDRYYPEGLTDDQKMTRIVGTPESVAPYYRELADQGIQYFVCQILDAADIETIRLLATKLAPLVRDE